MSAIEILRFFEADAADETATLTFGLLADALESDEMDAPSDWDAGNVTFDPYV